LDALEGTALAGPDALSRAAVAQGLAASGRVAKAIVSIRTLCAQCSRNEELWCLPELLRTKGTLVLDEGARGAAAVAEDHLLQALDVARQQAALSWELRCATTLARVWDDQGRSDEAQALLSLVYIGSRRASKQQICNLLELCLIFC
jgi:hypothetical protein